MLHIFAGPVGLSDDRWGRRALKKFEASSCREAYAASLKDCQYFDRFFEYFKGLTKLTYFGMEV